MSGIHSIRPPALPVTQSTPKESAVVKDEGLTEEAPLERFDHGQAEQAEAKYLQEARTIFENPDGIKPANKGLLATGFQVAANMANDLMAHFLLGPIPEPLPLEESQKMGKEELAEYKAQYPQVTDPERQARLDTAIAKAERALGKRPEGAEAVILETDAINASAFSDGTIVLGREHLDNLTDQQLLFATSHEVGHILNGDCKMVDAMTKHEKALGPLSPRQERLMTHRKKAIYHPFEKKADDAGVAGLEYHDVPKEHGATYFLRDFSDAQTYTGESDTHPAHQERVWRLASGQKEG